MMKAEIKRITAPSQPGEKVCKTPLKRLGDTCLSFYYSERGKIEPWSRLALAKK
jgi:hypothetical protein